MGSGHLEGVLKTATMNIYCNEKALEKAESDLLGRAGSVNSDWYSCDRVIIENKSKFTLEHVNDGCTTGWPVADVKKAFKAAGEDGDIFTIPPGAVATLFYRAHQGGQWGKIFANNLTFGLAMTLAQSEVEGYVAVKLRV